MEGVFRTLAKATKRSLDQGHIQHTVNTFDGPRTITLNVLDLSKLDLSELDMTEQDTIEAALHAVRAIQTGTMNPLDPENAVALDALIQRLGDSTLGCKLEAMVESFEPLKINKGMAKHLKH